MNTLLIALSEKSNSIASYHVWNVFHANRIYLSIFHTGNQLKLKLQFVDLHASREYGESRITTGVFEFILDIQFVVRCTCDHRDMSTSKRRQKGDSMQRLTSMFIQ